MQRLDVTPAHRMSTRVSRREAKPTQLLPLSLDLLYCEGVTTQQGTSRLRWKEGRYDVQARIGDTPQPDSRAFNSPGQRQRSLTISR